VKRIRYFSLVYLAGLALLATCFATTANAQTVEGKFTLTSEAQWGQAVLPAGVYTIHMDDAGASQLLRVSRGTKAVAMILAQSRDPSSKGEASLTIVNGVVRAFDLPEAGIEYRYSSHRFRPMTAPEEREISEVIPVVTTGT